MQPARVAVIGAGIAGLAAAHQVLAERPDAQVTVYEAADRVGGKLKRVDIAGLPVDVGAEAMLARRPEGLQAVGSARLSDRLIHPSTTSALVQVHGSLRRLPPRTLLGIPSDLASLRQAEVLSEDALRRIEAEPGCGPFERLRGDVTVGALVEQRFGREVVDRLVDPLLGGVYAGRADDISLQMALPALAALLRSEGGSLLHAAQDLLPPPDPSAPVFASLSGGLAQLPETLAADPRLTVRLGTTVRAIERADIGYRLVLGSAAEPSLTLVDAVIIATPAAKSGRLVAGFAPLAAAELATIEAAGVVIVSLAFDLADAPALPPASGVLIPESEGLPVKAMTFTSQKWPGFGSDRVYLRASLGRAGEQRDLQRTDDELLALVKGVLEGITGGAHHPIDTHVQRWGGGLPQYRVGHAELVARIRTALAPNPALAVCGASYDGVGIPACIASGRRAATQVLGALAPRAEH